MAPTVKTKLHYAWIVLGAACILNIVSRADSASFGVFIDPLVAQFGWSRGDISFAYSLAFLVGLPAVVIMGWLGDRFGARPIMVCAGLLIGTGTVLLGTIKELWQFYLFYGFFVGSLGHAAYTVLLPVIVTRWFHRHMGIAVGLYWAAQGLGPVIFAPLFRWLLENRGWADTFSVVGVVVGSILVIVSLFVHNSPASKGLTAYGAEDIVEKPLAAGEKIAAPVRLREILSQRLVWILAAIHHVGCAGHAIILAHVVSVATFRGISGIEAAGVLATIAGTSVISRFAFSVLAERLGGRTVLAISLLGQGLPVIILLFAQDAWTFYLFAVIFGLCYGGEMVGFPIINRQFFGAKAPLSSIYSFQMVGAGLGMALGGWLGGVLFDMSGDYIWSLLASFAMGCIGLPLALSLPRHKKPST
ncbi:MAG: MFS transporter [Burkholderiales bacterium]